MARDPSAPLCYNAIMQYRNARTLVGAGVLGLLAGCASGHYDSPPQPEGPSFSQIKAAPDSYKGQQVVWSGQVLGAKRLKESTRIEVLQLPLGEDQRLWTDLTQSLGRFVGLHKEFLDPATLPPGTFITVTGEVTGAITLPLDETNYTYPVIEIRKLTVRPHVQWAPISQVWPMTPYWGPYWNPYWRPYPFW